VTCFCLIGCLAFLWQIFLAFLHPLAQRSVVLAGSGVIGAIRHGWQILIAQSRRHDPARALLLRARHDLSRAGIGHSGAGSDCCSLCQPFLELLSGGIPTAASQLDRHCRVSLLLALVAQVLGGFFVAYQSAGYTSATAS
jgi:hypothetical protein